jgi:hypothetical protein
MKSLEQKAASERVSLQSPSALGQGTSAASKRKRSQVGYRSVDEPMLSIRNGDLYLVEIARGPPSIFDLHIREVDPVVLLETLL